MDGSVLDTVSNNVPTIIQAILDAGGQESKMYGEVVDNYYILVARDGTRSRVVAMFDTTNNCWTEVTSPDIRTAFRSAGDPFIMLGGYNGEVYRYPASTNIDGHGDPIEFTITGKKLADNPTAESYWRNAWVDVATTQPVTIDFRLLTDKGTFVSNGVPIEAESYSTDYWGDGSLWDDGSLWGQNYREDKYFHELGGRSFTGAYQISGQATSEVSINRVVIGYRDRRIRNVKYA
jgi:hypothetical protein